MVISGNLWGRPISSSGLLQAKLMMMILVLSSQCIIIIRMDLKIERGLPFVVDSLTTSALNSSRNSSMFCAVTTF